MLDHIHFWTLDDRFYGVDGMMKLGTWIPKKSLNGSIYTSSGTKLLRCKAPCVSAKKFRTHTALLNYKESDTLKLTVYILPQKYLDNRQRRSGNLESVGCFYCSN